MRKKFLPEDKMTNFVLICGLRYWTSKHPFGHIPKRVFRCCRGSFLQRRFQETNRGKTHENKPYISDGGNLDFWKKYPCNNYIERLSCVRCIGTVGCSNTHGRCPYFFAARSCRKLSGVRWWVCKGTAWGWPRQPPQLREWTFFLLCGCVSRWLLFQLLLSTASRAFPHLFQYVKGIKWFMWLEQLYQEGLFVKLFLFLNWRAYSKRSTSVS